MKKTELEKQKEINKFLADSILEHCEIGMVCPNVLDRLNNLARTGGLNED